MKPIDVLAAVLLVIGGLNWGLVGLFEFDLVAAIFGGSTAFLSKAVYTLVGLAAVYQVASLKQIRERWNLRPATA